MIEIEQIETDRLKIYEQNLLNEKLSSNNLVV